MFATNMLTLLQTDSAELQEGTTRPAPGSPGIEPPLKRPEPSERGSDGLSNPLDPGESLMAMYGDISLF